MAACRIAGVLRGHVCICASRRVLDRCTAPNANSVLVVTLCAGRATVQRRAERAKQTPPTSRGALRGNKGQSPLAGGCCSSWVLLSSTLDSLAGACLVAMFLVVLFYDEVQWAGLTLDLLR
jgi:hypothetical protein